MPDGTRGRKYVRDAKHGPAWFRDERIRVHARELLKAERKADSTDRFPADVQRFLGTLRGKHRRNVAGYMAHWARAFAERRRNEITDVDAQTAFAAIGRADGTRIHLRRALIKFYEALNGASGYNPGRSLVRPPTPEEPVRDLPWADIEAMFDAMQPSKAKARLMLIAYIGLPQTQIRALQPHHLRLDRRELVVHPRRKGRGAAGQVQPLSDLGIAALQAFQAAHAFGPFQNLQLVRAFHSAAKRAKVTLPAWARPYDLRHSFLTEVARSGADIEQIASLGIHATLEQARRYIKGAAAARATNTIQSVPRFSATPAHEKTPDHSSLLQTAKASNARTRRGKGRQKR